MKPLRWSRGAAWAVCRRAWFLLAGAVLATATQAATTLEISPQGLQSEPRSVTVELRARFTPGASVTDFWIRYNGRDVTPDFLRHATIVRPDAGSIVASLEVLFPPGRHDLSASLTMSGDAALRQGRGKWRIFVNYCNSTLGDRGVPDAAQREAFRRLVGFEVDSARVKAAYLSAGMDKTWFDAATVHLVSPTGGSVSTDRIDADATVLLSEGTRVDRVGFLVNGTVVYATLQNDAFFATLPLQVGRNTIQAGLITRPAPGTEVEVVMSTPVTVTRQAATPACPQVTNWSNADQGLFAPLRITRVDHGNTPSAAYFYALANPNDRQERTIRATYFTLAGAPALTRDLGFSNNLGLGLYSFASAAEARTVWDREMAAWDAIEPADRPELLLRDDTTLVWAWTAWLDGQRNLLALSLLDGSVIAAHSLRSMAAGETSAGQGMASLIGHLLTTRGLVDQKCAGR